MGYAKNGFLLSATFVLLFLVIALPAEQEIRACSGKNQSPDERINQLAMLQGTTEPALTVKSRKRCFWVEGGLGVGLFGAAGNFDLTYQYDKHILSVGVDVTAAPSSDVADDAGEIFFIYQQDLKQSRNRYFAPGAGIGYVISGMDNAIGVSIQVQYAIRPISFLGTGIRLFGNINGVEPYFGITLCLQLGKVR